MSFLSGLKDFVSGLTRGFALFFTERNDYIVPTSALGLTTRRRD